MNETNATKSKQARQRKWLGAYKANLFNIAKACREIGINRTTYYRWLENDPRFAEMVHDAREEKIDFIESKLFQKIQKGDTISIIFALKTLAKSRGYVERQEISGPEGQPIANIDVKAILKNPKMRVALETIAKGYRHEDRKISEHS